MRRLSLMLALALLGLLGAAPAVQAAPSSVFTGEWSAEDHVDLSTMHLIVGPGSRPQILWIDEVATSACAGQDVETFTSLLKGFVDGDTLNATFIVAKCGPVTIFTRANAFDESWVLDDQGDTDPANDTLEDNFGDIWSRV